MWSPNSRQMAILYDFFLAEAAKFQWKLIWQINLIAPPVPSWFLLN